ncbi:MAG: hypothetical protein QGG42_15595 [Phycisphaerae bacterium]|nr:hypothetical protein [Phycisphaerae bacterium]
MTTTEELTIPIGEPDGISVVRWFAFYAVVLASAGIWLWILVGHLTVSLESLPEMPRTVKLLTFAIYASLGCTFIPLPVNVIVAAAATHTAAVGTGLWDTVLLIGAVGAVASTLANLNDYHLFTWMLRSHRIASIRHTRIYRLAARWFDKSPFFLVAVFNILPIPVDVVRILATTNRYPRIPFAAANLIGRFIRYSVIAFLIYYFELSMTTAILIMLGLAVAMLLAKLLPGLLAPQKTPEASCDR